MNTRHVIALSLGILLLAGCASGSAAPVADQPTAAATDIPSTITPPPTASPEPTLTPTEQPTQAPTDVPMTPTLVPTTDPALRCEFRSRGMYGDAMLSRSDYVDDTDDFVFTSPRAQGMDITVLRDDWTTIAMSPTLKGLIVMRNDAVVLESYFNGAGRQTSGNLYSASKSLISALVGIAIDQGFIGSVDDPVATYFPELFPESKDSRYRRITIEHLLTMTSGLEWEEGDYEVFMDGHWVENIWWLPIDDPAGATWNYSTANTHTLSALVARSSGMNTCEFAYTYLFDPLGITVEHWAHDDYGDFLGGAHVYLTTREMAKFGQLFLHQGEWNGEQVISAEWVQESWARPVWGNNPGYGYQWWRDRVNGYDVFSAMGAGQQAIHVIPELNIVVAVLQELDAGEPFDTLAFLGSNVIPAVDDVP